jgi:hypothetical protein
MLLHARAWSFPSAMVRVSGDSPITEEAESPVTMVVSTQVVPSNSRSGTGACAARASSPARWA